MDQLKPSKQKRGSRHRFDALSNLQQKRKKEEEIGRLLQ